MFLNFINFLYFLLINSCRVEDYYKFHCSGGWRLAESHRLIIWYFSVHRWEKHTSHTKLLMASIRLALTRKQSKLQICYPVDGCSQRISIEWVVLSTAHTLNLSIRSPTATHEYPKGNNWQLPAIIHTDSSNTICQIDTSLSIMSSIKLLGIGCHDVQSSWFYSCITHHLFVNGPQ